ncbi:hypothetical protein OEA41_000454 [Lepraria neglecta]|uniref:Orc1-like AAA ATPase domain-containing protein n=1 Tax=Lepraria neglecta TaxID=209136 RepID=A0AAD9ZFR9_9LECA|nr:hypothetical protein OEA41_000454 [Lepraria neglecta]
MLLSFFRQIQKFTAFFATNMASQYNFSRDNSFDQLMYTHDLSSRTQSFGGDVIAIHDEDFWRPLTQQYDTFLRDVSDDFEHIDKLAQMGQTRSRYEEVVRLQSLLSLTSGSFEEQAKLPCAMLPFDKTSRFYNRHGYLEQIEDFLSSGAAGLRSIALYGLGGVGKSTVAREYAQSKAQILDAILWLPEAHINHHAENRVDVLNWLQMTKSEWLMAFDNAEDVDLLLQYWPLASRGTVIATTRNHTLAFEPAQSGIE